MANDYYDSSDKTVVSGEVAEASDLNTINTAIESACDLIEADIDSLDSNQSYYSDLAQSWAEEPEDTEVETGKYSALHHAAKAADSATAAASSASAASSSASSASSSASAASTAQTNAETAETNAETAETNAETAETNAETAQTAAEAAQTAAEAAEAGSIAAAASIEDTAYGVGWNGDITAAASKNALYDKIELLVEKDADTGAASIPVGTEAQRPGTPAKGMFRFNDDDDTFEGYDGSAWAEVGAEGFYDAYVKVSDVKAQNTAGGSFTSGSWVARDINTEDSDPQSIASISSNQITLSAGTYRCIISCPAHKVDSHQTRLYDTTGTAVLLTGSSEYADEGNRGQTRSVISGRFTLAAQSVVEVQHRCETTNGTDGMGTQANFTSEVYTIAEFWREV